MSKSISATNIAAMYKESAEKFAELPAFATREKSSNAKNPKWSAITFGELYETGLDLATGLIELGIKAKEHIALLADNRVEWIIADYGIQLAGAADVPRGTDVTDADIQYILDHADCKVVFVEHLEMYNKLKKNLPKLKKIKTIILMDPKEKAPSGTLSMSKIIEDGKKARAKGNKKAEERIAAIEPSSLFTLIYTSGTTGAPKGVMLSHANMISQLANMTVRIHHNDRILSILPVWHIFERVFEMIAIGAGACTYYTSVRHIAEDMKLVQPTFIGSAPRLWENLYHRIMEQVKNSHIIRRMLFRAAYFCSHRFQDSSAFLMSRSLDLHGRNPVISLALALFHIIRWVVFLAPHGLLNTAVLEKLRQAVGGSLKGSVSGGGALPVHIDKFFNYIGIPVLEGYGMTETSPILAVRTYEQLVIGTVGPIFPQTEIHIIDLNTGELLYPNPAKPKMGKGLRGEIHARGPQIMQGYYKNPEATKRVLKDGFMNTGDIGMVTFNNCLKILGRSKDTVVLLSGENVEPVPIENKLLESPLIDQCMVVGQDEKALGVLVVPSLPDLARVSIQVKDLAEAQKNPAVHKAIGDEIKRLISQENGFKGFERIQHFAILPKAFEIGDELTAKLSVKRHVVSEKYKKQIKELYGEKK